MLTAFKPDNPDPSEPERSPLFPRMKLFLQMIKGYFSKVLKWIETGQQKAPACKH
jgi:hypothetical protein